jgi:hypothetical protein
VVVTVATRPIRSVTAAIAESRVSGSKWSARAIRERASGLASQTAALSARNIMSNLARSAVRAISA